jgi:hypothetical protein
MPSWPSLPAPLANGVQESFADNLHRTPMDIGPAKVRRRTTANPRPLSFNMLLSKAQLSTLETFYNSTVSGGALAFDMTHPRTGATVSCRFLQPPAFSSVNGLYFTVSVSLEVLP